MISYHMIPLYVPRLERYICRQTHILRLAVLKLISLIGTICRMYLPYQLQYVGQACQTLKNRYRYSTHFRHKPFDTFSKCAFEVLAGLNIGIAAIAIWSGRGLRVWFSCIMYIVHEATATDTHSHILYVIVQASRSSMPDRRAA